MPLSVTVSLSVCPCASAAILPSFLSLPGVLYFFASSLHQPPFSSRLLSLSPSPHVVVLLYLTPRSCPTTSILLPLLDSILFLPLPLPPSLRLSFFLSPCIMLFLIYLSHSVFCWVFKIRYSLSLSLCPVFHLFDMMPLSSFHRCPRLSLHVLMLQCAFAFKAIFTFNTLVCPTC